MYQTAKKRVFLNLEVIGRKKSLNEGLTDWQHKYIKLLLVKIIERQIRLEKMFKADMKNKKLISVLTSEHITVNNLHFTLLGLNFHIYKMEIKKSHKVFIKIKKIMYKIA